MNSPISFSFWPENLNQAELSDLAAFEKIINNPKNGFFHWTQDTSAITQVETIYNHFKHKKVFVQIGIGGSSLGPEMLISALKKNHDVKFIFLNNIDSEEIHDQLRDVSPKDALFYVVSKSGSTAETIAGFAITMNWGQFKVDEIKDHYVFCTDPVAGDLRKIANDFGVKTLSVPSNIGGRFSVLTAVGLLPARFAEVDLKGLYKGAEKIKECLLVKDKSNPLLVSTSMLMKLKEVGVTQTIVMPYSSKLRNLSFWFVQLWAESLGKKVNLEGNVVNTGLTPLPAYGATDQHSQVQLFMEGPYDKCFFLIKNCNPSHNYELACGLDYPAFKSLVNVNLNQLMEAELIGTIQAMTEAKRPHVLIEIPANNEESMGAMILYFESLTALMGYRLNIDPFDQPGVEAGKKYAWEHIKRS